MSVEIKEITGKRELKEFVFLPEKIHRDHTGWVPPIYSQEWHYLDPGKNKAFSYSDYVLALALRNGKAVGRIMGIINRKYNEYKQERNARFGYLECPEDQTVFNKLLTYVEDWAREKGMVKIVGPMGFNNHDPNGFLIEGFEYNPTFGTYYNFPYINRLIINGGYSKEIDYVVYKVIIPKEMPEFYTRIYNRISSRGEYTLYEFSKRKQIKPFIIPILELMNECFAELYGFQPLENMEMKNLGKRYLPALDPRFVKVVTKNNLVIGFNIAMPNLTKGIRKAKGRLTPLGIIYILREAKKTRQLDSLIGAIKKEYRGRGIDVMMGYTTLVAARKAGFEFADSHHEMEDNLKVRAEMERLGGQVYKRFRIYKKEL
jgi:hypothetical protein